MQKVLTAEQMREVDRLTTEKYGIPSILLMENAAHAVARVITEKLGGSVNGRSILVLCGPGNNGGDGAALARILWTQGADVWAILFGKIENTKGDARTNFETLKAIVESPRDYDDYASPQPGVLRFSQYTDGEYFRKMFRPHRPQEVVVDAILGTGLSRPLDEDIDQVINTPEFFNEKEDRELEFLLVSVDVPTGLASDQPFPAESNVEADVTVTFTAPKIANVMPPVCSANGELFVADIGTPQELVNEVNSQLFVSEAYDVKVWLSKSGFEHDDYKNKRGHALVIAGSDNYSGAAVLAGNAAMRSGAGLVTVVTPKSSKDSVASRVLPEVIVRGVSETADGAIAEEAFDEIDELLSKADSIAIGCGLSQDESTRKFVEDVIATRRVPVIVDADAINLLSPFAEHVSNQRVRSPHVSKGSAEAQLSAGATNWPPADAGGSDLILTPHEGEFMRLLGTDDKDAINDRVATVREFAVKHDVILVLKGERVLIGEPSGKVVVNPTGNSGLGKAGNGDTLTGILAGFVAQASVMKIDIFETVVAAVYVAGMAGDNAEKKYGKRVMTASDVRECLAETFQEMSSLAKARA